MYTVYIPKTGSQIATRATSVMKNLVRPPICGVVLHSQTFDSNSGDL